MVQELPTVADGPKTLLKAILVSVNWETEEVMHSFITGDDAMLSVEALMESIRDDWPGYYHYVIGTEDAARQRMRKLLGPWTEAKDVGCSL